VRLGHSSMSSQGVSKSDLTPSGGAETAGCPGPFDNPRLYARRKSDRRRFRVQLTFEAPRCFGAVPLRTLTALPTTGECKRDASHLSRQYDELVELVRPAQAGSHAWLQIHGAVVTSAGRLSNTGLFRLWEINGGETADADAAADCIPLPPDVGFNIA